MSSRESDLFLLKPRENLTYDIRWQRAPFKLQELSFEDHFHRSLLSKGWVKRKNRSYFVTKLARTFSEVPRFSALHCHIHFGKI